MQTVSSIYLEGMGEMVRRPSRMRLTFHYPTGDIIYTNRDIVKVTEKKTAHLIAGELPAVELEMELMNLDGSFNPNDISGLHDLIVKGVPVTYEFGYDIPNLQYYGYTDDGEEHDYGMEENVPYGFMEGYATEWIPGGEVFTSGEISYSKTTATISARDHLSFLDEHVLLAYGNRTLAQVAKDVLNLTDYPKEDDGDPKIITGPELDAFNTAITLSETEDESISAKEHLQTIAHACGVQMYIDRAGYIHLDNDKRGVGAVYELPLSQQGEEPEHRKEQMPKKVVITLNSEYGDPVETDLNGGGETMTVENPFIVTTAEGETLRDIVYDHFIKYRNTADIPYRGEPALDILDTITLGTEFGGDVEAIVVGTELEFDGTLSGSLSVRYQLGGNTPEKVQIKGSGNFIYPLGEEDEPSITSFDLVCDTTFDAPTYQWSYFTVSNGSWLNIAGATSNTINVAYNSPYYDNDSSVKFRCVVNGIKGAITQISKIQLQKSETAGYRGVQKKATKEEIDVPSPQIGDVVLLDNTDNEDAGIYGEAHVYDGEKWVATEDSDALAMTYKDALELAELSEKTIYASKIFTDLLVANKGFITNLEAENITAGTGDGTTGGFRFRAKSRTDLSLPYDPITNPSVFDIYQDDKQLFKVDITTGEVEMGNYTSGNGTLYIPSTGEFKGKFSEVRNVLPYQYEDSLDASHPFEIDFYIPSETVNIASVKLNAKGLKYRAYSSAVGYSNPWGDDYYTESATPSMSLTMPSWDNANTGSGGNAHTHAYDKASSSTGSAGSHTHSVGSSWSTATTGYSSTSGDYHTHSYNPAVSTSGSGGDHEHTISSSAATTGNTTDSHTHSYKIPTGVSGGSHSHKVTVDLEHNHAMTFGIYEGTIPASVSLYCDNGAGYGSAIVLGSNVILANELDLTSYFTGTGWKRLKFTSTRLGRIIANLILQVDITV